MSVHTSGPWLLGDDNENVIATDEVFVADTSTPWRPVLECEANARLIAAAPKLLAAAIDFLKNQGTERGYDAAVINLRAAIAEATGETP